MVRFQGWRYTLVTIMVIYLLSPFTPVTVSKANENPVIAPCLTIDKNTRQEITLAEQLANTGTYRLPPSNSQGNLGFNFSDSSAKKLFRSALAAYALNDLPEASNLFWAALSTDPDYTLAYYNFWLTNRLQTATANRTALIQLQTLAEKQPNNPHVFWAISLFYATLNEFAQQKIYLQKALDLNAKFAPALYEKARIADREQQPHQADRYLRQAMLNAPNFLPPYSYFVSRPPFAVSPEEAEGLIQAGQTNRTFA
jgi:tetratricopeptide (TPR) repeat protein